MGLSFSMLFSTWNGVLLCNISDFVADFKEPKAISPSSRSSSSQPENMTLTRSLSFQDWGSIPSETVFPSKDKNPVGIRRNHLETFNLTMPAIVIDRKPVVFLSPRPQTELDAAATTVQKVYKSYRTRRNLADCAVVVEELWWKTLDSAALKRFSVSFFDLEKKESAASRWTRATARLAKVGKGLSKDEKAQKLALRHWLEAIDARHRYGHNLHLYYDIWFDSKSSEPFFYWLDVGDGKEISHDKCPRTELQRQCITYLGPKEREAFEVIVDGGKLVYRTDGTTVNTTDGTKWIFVLSTSKRLYIGQKKKGTFQHSSFLSGAAITAAGRLVARDGTLEAIWPYSGHYLPTEDNFNEFIAFLEQNHLDLTNVKRCSVDDDDASFKLARKSSHVERRENGRQSFADVARVSVDNATVNDELGLKSPLSRFDGSNRLSCKWTSGFGPRIGCLRDYPQELQNMAFVQVNLSPRVSQQTPIPSPRPSPKLRVSPRLAYMGLPSPRVS